MSNTPPALAPTSNNVQKKSDETIKVLLENIATLEKVDYPNWRAIVKLQSQLIRLMSASLKDQKDAFKKINEQLTNMEKRLKSNTIPISDMQTLANILKPFLAKTYQNNKQLPPPTTAMGV